jgi:hypothetical protein
LGLLDNALFGSSKATGAVGDEVITAREFDITQYGKKMAVLIGVLTPAIVGALKLFHVSEVTPAMVIAALAVTAVSIFSASLVMAVDMIARAMVTRQPIAGSPSGSQAGKASPGSPDPPKPGEEVRVKTTEKRISRA